MRRFAVLFFFLAAARIFPAPAIFFPLDQTPVTGTRATTNAATTNTTFWGTLAGSGAPPVLTNGASATSGKAWQFNGGYYLGVGPDAVTRSLGDITNTPGLSVAFWVRYTNSATFVRVCGLGGSGETFDFSTQSGGKMMFAAGYQPNNTRWVSMTPNNVVFDNNWHHVAGSLDFRRTVNNAVVFVDGMPVLTNSATFFGNFTNAGTLAIGARGNGSATACALDQFIVFTNSLQAAEVAQLYLLGSATNYAPIISVSAAQTSLAWTNGATNVTTTLAASISDDGLPNSPGSVTKVWTQAGGPTYAAIFSMPTNTVTTVTFTNTGVFILRCTAGDGALSNWDEVTVNVFSNAAPVVAAWTPLTTVLATNPTTLPLNGWVMDDGQPNPPNLVTTLWKCVSSPGNVAVTFGNATNINTTVTVPTNAGVYALRLTANDSLLNGTADVTINVVTNLAPALSAWTTAPIAQWPWNQFRLQASVSDDGRPNPPGLVTSMWSKVSGPGTVTFGNATTTNTTATCSMPGIYQLRIVASDSAAFVTNDVWVNIWSNSPGCLPPPSVRKFSTTPPPYVHPRIFFTDADRPEMQARATNDAIVAEGIYQATYGLSAVVSNTIDNPASIVGQTYARLAAGDTSVDTMALVQQQTASADFLNGDANSGLYGPLESACYLAWLWPTNAARLQQLATAVATAAACHQSWYVNLPASSKGELSPDVYADLGFCYDLMYDRMSESQRATTRNFISLMTTNRHTIGWNEADYSDSTNWRSHHDHLILAQLAIEGETGFDAAALATNAASLKTFTTRWGITEGGCNREGNGYFAMGMRNLSLAALALSRRGENYLVTTRIYNSQQQGWYMLAPWGTYMFDHQDGGAWGNPSYGTPMVYFYLMKFIYPDDALADSVFQNNRAYTPNNTFPLLKALFGNAPLTNNPNFAATAAAKFLSLGKFDWQRGLGTARSDWSTNAMQLDFDCRFDTMTLGHLHSDRNNFTLQSLGRTWFGDPGYHLTENDGHSTVLIDGVGEAGCSVSNHWPSLPGRFVEFRAETVATLFSGDAKPAYEYSWDWNNLGSGSGYQPYTSYVGTGLTTPWRWTDMMYSPPADLTGANAWMTNYIRANPAMFDPVQRAFRTAMLLRGTKPYALIVDDIQKDNAMHAYDWSANTIGLDPIGGFEDPNPDVTFVSGPDATNAVICHASDTNGWQPRLLIRVLDAKGIATPIQIIDTTNALGNRTKRLVVSRSTIAPDFKILLFPHLPGDELPTTTWSNNIVTVTMADGQTDRIYFNTNSDGRTRVATYRIAGQNSVATVPSLAATGGVTQIALNWNAPPGATGYVLKVSTNNGAVYSLLASNLVSASFTHTNLVPGTNYFYVVAAINTNGVSEDSAPASATPLAANITPPLITGIQIAGGNLVVSGTNGTAGANYVVLTATNLAVPVANWNMILTQQFGAGGAVSFTNALNPVSPQAFFRLRAP